jgi:hypothetical protein
MSRRRKSSDTTPFDTLRLEGSLFVPELLERAASGEAAFQKESDYAIPKGLKLHDEYGRAFRIATATWQAFAPQMVRADLDAATVTRAFVIDLLRQCLGYTDLQICAAPLAANGEPQTANGEREALIQNSTSRGFPVTALGGHLPVIIAPHHLGLDDPDPRFAVIGSGLKKKSAHQLAQEFLNASPNCLWAIVTNGKILRLLRDADTLTRPNFLEFDLETILRDEQQRYADFAALWRILHASRCSGGVSPPSSSSPASSPAECIWEKWKLEGHAQGLRVRDGLRDGVTQAILILGRGFLAHPDNTVLRQRLDDGTLSLDDYFQQFFRLIYRCLFLFCTEERDLLHTLDSSPAARKAYASGYSLRRLRRRALRHSAHDPHGDLWLSLRIVFRSLAGGQPRLALPALGGLFAETQCPDLDGASLSNRDLLSAMRELRWFFDKKTGKRSAIDYRNMGTEELGSVYESLLELVPTIDLPARSFGFVSITDAGSTAGNARKTTGSYYTADPLVMELITSALEPVISQRLADARELAGSSWSTVAARIATDSVQRSYVHAWMVKHLAVPIDATPEAFARAWDAIPAEARANPLCVEALLSITVCDPSCGSGHFLLAAARRLAERLAELRSPDGAVRPEDYRHALREVASRCLYGVDINPMAVELCRVALWLETVDPGKPLGFLDHHIRCGNSLLGTTPDLIAAGLPDETFTAIEGDDKPACAELKKRNKAERTGFGPLFAKEEDSIREKLRQAATAIEAMDDSQPAALQQKEAAFLTNETAPEHRHAKLLADLWCTAFVIKKCFKGGSGGSGLRSLGEAGPPTSSSSQSQIFNPQSSIIPPVEGQLIHTDDDLFGQPVTAAKPTAKLKSSSSSSLEIRHPATGITTGTLRDYVQGKPLPDGLESEVNQLASQYHFFHWHLAFPQVFDQGGFTCILGNPPWEQLEQDSSSFTDRVVSGAQHFIQNSGRYPYCGKGRKNLYGLFCEAVLSIRLPNGSCGIIVQTGILQDEPANALAEEMMKSGQLKAVYEFENRRKNYDGQKWFSDADPSMRFVLLTISRTDKPTIFVFDVDELSDLIDPQRVYRQTHAQIQSFCGKVFKVPMFKRASDAQLAAIAYSNGTQIGNLSQGANPNISSGLVFNFEPETKRKKISHRLRPRDEEFTQVYEGSYIHQFDHRFATAVEDTTRYPILSEKADPSFQITTLDFLPAEYVEKRLKSLAHYAPSWFLALRRQAKGVNELVAISTIVPAVAAEGSLTAFFSPKRDAIFSCCLAANLNSFTFNYLIKLRQAGFNLNKGVYECIPVVCSADSLSRLSLDSGDLGRVWISSRVLGLCYTAWDLQAFAQDCGWPGPPFRWDEDRRFLLRCELDAAFFHLYLGSVAEWQQQPEALTRAFPTPRDAVSYIMDTFPIVKRKDEAKHGAYRTKDTILQIYDALATGHPYQTLLAPPPADPACCHPLR